MEKEVIVQNLLERIERWKLLAEQFAKEDISVFIKEDNGNLHFCKILVVGDESVLVENFGPQQRAGTQERIYWLLIKDFDKYEEREEGK